MSDNKQKHMTLLRVLYGPSSGAQEIQSVSNAVNNMSETEQVEFSDFQHKVGNVYLAVMDDLDKGLEELADEFPEETDPRKWDVADWVLFKLAVHGHKYEEIYTTYASQEQNIHLVWKEIESRI